MPRRPHRGAILAAALSLALPAGCAMPPATSPPPPGFSADTFTREGLTGGATATAAGCHALPDAVWVEVPGRRECIRFVAAFGGRRWTLGERENGGPADHGPDRAAPPPTPRIAIVYIPGDPAGAAYRDIAGLPQVEGVSEHYELSPATRQAGVEALSGAMRGLPVINLGRPGMHGSSGHHARDRQGVAEVALLDAALTRLARGFGLDSLVLVGWSSGGLVAANLLARRRDIGCAVLASAPLDLARLDAGPARPAAGDHVIPWRGSAALADPMRTVQAIALPGPRILVLGDRGDRMVPAAAWQPWVAAARARGLDVHAVEVVGLDRPELAAGGATRHQTSSQAMEAAYGCAAGLPTGDILRALQAGTPVLTPGGRPLSGAEIAAAFAGRRLRATEWYPRVNVLSEWGGDGRLSYLDVRQGARRIAAGRWWVEGDRLCTDRHGCGAVLSDGRLLHLMAGDAASPRLRVTFVPAEAGG